MLKIKDRKQITQLFNQIPRNHVLVAKKQGRKLSASFESVQNGGFEDVEMLQFEMHARFPEHMIIFKKNNTVYLSGISPKDKEDNLSSHLLNQAEYLAYKLKGDIRPF